MNALELLQQLVKRTSLTEFHLGILRQLEPKMAPMAPEVALAFYDYLGRDVQMHQILWAVPGRVERLYESFAAWYRGLYAGHMDAHYAHSRAKIGLVHAMVGIKPSFIMPAMGIVQELSLEHMRNTVRGPEIFTAVEAFEKIMAIEAAIMQESYFMALEQGRALNASHSQDQALSEGAKVLLAQSQ